MYKKVTYKSILVFVIALALSLMWTTEVAARLGTDDIPNPITKTPTSEPTKTVNPTKTSEPTKTVAPTETTVPTPEPTETPLPTATATVKPTETVAPTATPRLTETPPTQRDTPTPTGTVAPTETVMPTQTETPKRHNTPQPTVTATQVVVVLLPESGDLIPQWMITTGAVLACIFVVLLVLYCCLAMASDGDDDAGDG